MANSKTSDQAWTIAWTMPYLGIECEELDSASRDRDGAHGVEQNLA